jgi:hypothetical protein
MNTIMATSPLADQVEAQPRRSGGDLATGNTIGKSAQRGRPCSKRPASAQNAEVEGTVAEVLVQFTDLVFDDEGRAYTARACGAEMDDGRWQGWIEFLPVNDESPIRSGRETTQPNRQHVEYWATGLSEVYLEGALQRALKPFKPPPEPAIPPPVFDGPAEPAVAPGEPESILNPFSVYRKGEELLRSQLAALSSWHLANIIRAHGLSELDGSALNRMSPEVLSEIIVQGVRRRQPVLGQSSQS